ncbi:MAG: S8 family serine peptidase [Planctomycetes bacterium]|nr:S8 family serine peptidase [Planctomycetota bacterium]
MLYAQPDHIFHLTRLPNEAETPTAEFDKQWPLLNRGQTIQGQTGNVNADIDANVAWDFWQGDADFRVAVIDTGVDYNHPDLAANIWTNTGEIPNNGMDDDGNGYVDDYHGYNFLYDPVEDPIRDGFDQDGHGTNVTGIIAAVGDNELGLVGINWRAKIVPLRACDADGCAESKLVLAVQYCIDTNIKLSNNSYGFCEQSSTYPGALYDAFKQARDQIGHLAVAGAGNYIDTQGGPRHCTTLNNDLSAVWPASFGEDNEPNNPGLGSVIAVAATNNQDRLWASGSTMTIRG